MRKSSKINKLEQLQDPFGHWLRGERDREATKVLRPGNCSGHMNRRRTFYHMYTADLQGEAARLVTAQISPNKMCILGFAFVFTC